MNRLSGSPAAGGTGLGDIHARSLDFVRAQFESIPPAGDLTADGALRELLGESVLYGSGVGSPKADYNETLVSWPPADASPIKLEQHVRAADISKLTFWRSSLLRSKSEADSLRIASGLHKPYSDPCLISHACVYGRFLSQLHSRGIVRFKKGKWPANIGTFFVFKKSGALRIIVDTRLANTLFRDPDHTELPTAAGWSQIHAFDGDAMFVGGADIDNAFHRMSIPDELAQMFTLPAVLAQHVAGVDADADGWLTPYWTTLPMGWNWSAYFCQSVLERASDEAGLEAHARVRDRIPGPELKLAPSDSIDIPPAAPRACSYCHGQYLDNVVVVGVDRDEVNRRLRGGG